MIFLNLFICKIVKRMEILHTDRMDWNSVNSNEKIVNPEKVETCY